MHDEDTIILQINSPTDTHLVVKWLINWLIIFKYVCKLITNIIFLARNSYIRKYENVKNIKIYFQTYSACSNLKFQTL